MRPYDTFTMEQTGDYIYSLESVLWDGTTEHSYIDKRIISVLTKTAEAEFDLEDWIGTEEAMSVDIDSEYKLWVLTNAGGRYQFNPHYDTMMIDPTKKKIYFKEPYEDVVVTSGVS